ncbi:hypothetical protein [Shewanella sp. SG41-3]|uniref:hypothetical protein n=1 Tax=Shewanella sp. SG41-3 TaxID=2760977 RepID=UPI0016021477|nr:hypothetical protein [Shewanella sp. SG41-3]MBB1475919.1 hypothetical protein [Shewanella sp. SG41-3]
MRLILLCTACILMGCQPSDSDFDKRVDEFKSTDIGKDIANNKFVPPYSSFDPLLDFTEWCNSVLWVQKTTEEQFIDEAFLREDILALAPKEIIGFKGATNDFIEKSGGSDAIYQYAHGDAAYLMKPSRLAVPVIRHMLKENGESPSFKKVMALNQNKPKRSKSFKDASDLCFTADVLTGVLGGESRSRAIIKDVSTLVRKNTLQER